jgi:hypothetical protein
MSKRVAPLDQLLDSLEVTLELRDASVPRERSGAGMLELTCGASVRFSPEGVTIAPPRRSLRVVPNSTAIRIRVGCQGTLDLFEHLSEPCASTPSACSPSRSWPASPA